MNSGMVWRRRPAGFFAFFFFLLSVLVSSALGQGLTQAPYSGSSVGAGSAFSLSPGGRLAAPLPNGGPAEGSNSVALSSRMFRDIFPIIPNLEIGYLYNFGKNLRTGRLTVDYVLPRSLGQDSTVFGEAHGEFTDFWKTIQRLFRSSSSTTSIAGLNERMDLSFGGGFRKIFNETLIVGINGFYDTSRLGGQWYGSGGFGFEMAGSLSGNDALDLNLNFYGNLFNRNTLVNTLRRGPENFDFEAGYSHELFDGGPDLRLSATGYRFCAGDPVYGWRTAAELKSRDGMFMVRYAAAHDRVNGTYQTVGAFVNVGFQLDRLVAGDNPFTMPEPVFASPRNLRSWLGRKVRRNNYQNALAVVSGTLPASQGQPAKRQPTFVFTLVNKGGPNGRDFDEAQGVPLTTLSYPYSQVGAGANTYSVAILDPDGLITTPTVAVTVTPNLGSFFFLSVDPDANSGAAHPIVVARDGTPTNVVLGAANLQGTPYAQRAGGSAPITGSILIQGAGVQDLQITVTAY